MLRTERKKIYLVSFHSYSICYSLFMILLLSCDFSYPFVLTTAGRDSKRKYEWVVRDGKEEREREDLDIWVNVLEPEVGSCDGQEKDGFSFSPQDFSLFFYSLSLSPSLFLHFFFTHFLPFLNSWHASQQLDSLLLPNFLFFSFSSWLSLSLLSKFGQISWNHCCYILLFFTVLVQPREDGNLRSVQGQRVVSWIQQHFRLSSLCLCLLLFLSFSLWFTKWFTWESEHHFFFPFFKVLTLKTFHISKTRRGREKICHRMLMYPSRKWRRIGEEELMEREKWMDFRENW